ncbi:MAG: hypothetical protein ACK5X9_07640 [Alphaproteobacteria bacterium]
MTQKSSAPPARVPAEKLIRDIRRSRRMYHSAVGKSCSVLKGLGFEKSIEKIRK